MAGYDIPLLDEGGESDTQAIRLGTRKSRHIRNEMRPEWGKEELLTDFEKCRAEHPDAIPRSVTATYNCVGMVFATRRTWVEPEFVPQFLEDDDYKRLPKLDDARVGDVVVYKDDTGEIAHVGIIIERHEDLRDATISFKVLSKWGPWAEFIHDPEDVLPNFGIPTEVWTDRKLT